jgi:hypothetical protein
MLFPDRRQNEEERIALVAKFDSLVVSSEQSQYTKAGRGNIGKRSRFDNTEQMFGCQARSLFTAVHGVVSLTKFCQKTGIGE